MLGNKMEQYLPNQCLDLFKALYFYNYLLLTLEKEGILVLAFVALAFHTHPGPVSGNLHPLASQGLEFLCTISNDCMALRTLPKG